jgi:hypothetical protein
VKGLDRIVAPSAPHQRAPEQGMGARQRLAERDPQRSSSGTAAAVVAALQVGHAHEQARLRGLAALEEPVDEGLAAQDLVAPDERVAQEVRVEAVVLEVRFARGRELDHARILPELRAAIGEHEIRAQVRGILRDHALELRGRLRKS